MFSFCRSKTILLAIVVSSTVLTAAMLWLGPGERTQFSPNGLCFRRQTVWYIPLLDIPTISHVTSNWPHPLLEMWIERGYLTRPESAGDWELAGYWARGCSGNETILHDLVCPKEVGFPEHWQKWTATHPGEASLLWPSVIKHIRSRQYHEAIEEMQRYAWGGIQ